MVKLFRIQGGLLYNYIAIGPAACTDCYFAGSNFIKPN